jgi:hypothetical protein
LKFLVGNHPHRSWQNAYHESLIACRYSTGESPSNIQNAQAGTRQQL